MWTALRPTPSDSRGVALDAWRVSRRATESAPPERATQMRSPGLRLERSKGSAEGIGSMLVGWEGVTVIGGIRADKSGRPMTFLFVCRFLQV
jgi:hypothetical protein